MNQKDKPADTYCLLSHLQVPVRVAHYVDIILDRSTVYLRFGALDAENILHYLKAPIKLAYDLPIGALLAPGKPIEVNIGEFCSYKMITRDLRLPDIELLPLQNSAAACEEVLRADKNLCAGAMQGLRCNGEIYLLAPFTILRAFVGTEGSLLTMLARGEDPRKKYVVNIDDDDAIVLTRARISDRVLALVIEYDANPALSLFLNDIQSHLAAGDCTSELYLPEVPGCLRCRTITVAGYHIVLDADAVSLPASLSRIVRLREPREKKPIEKKPSKKPLPKVPRVDLAASDASEKNKRTAQYRKEIPAFRFDKKVKCKSMYLDPGDAMSYQPKDNEGSFEPSGVYSAQDVDPECPFGSKNSRPAIEFEARTTMDVNLPKGYECFREFADMISRLSRWLAVTEVKIYAGRYPETCPVSALRGRQYLFCFIRIYQSFCACVMELDQRHYPACSTLVVRLQRPGDEVVKICVDVLEQAGGHWGKDWVNDLSMAACPMKHRTTYGLDRRESRLAQIITKLVYHPYS